MIDKLKKDKFYIKYGVIIVFISIMVVVTVKVITHGENILDWSIYQLKRLLDICAPIIYAILLAYLLFQPIKYIEKNIYKYSKKRLNSKVVRSCTVLVTLIIVIILCIVTYNFLVPPILNSIKSIVNSLPEIQEQLREFVNQIVESLNSKNIDVENTGQLTGEIVDKVGGAAEDVLNGIVVTVSNISAFLLDFVVTVILTIYFLIDKERLVIQLKKLRDVLLPKKVGNKLTTFLLDLDNIVGKFIIGEILDSIIVGIVSTVLLLIIKHPFALLIGVIAGATNIIPYVGPIIGAALAFLFGVFTSVPLGVAGAVLLLLYQQIDGNFIQPKIVGDKIGLSPVWVLIVVLIGGSYFGAVGMILSMPLAGLVRVYFNRYAIRKKNKNYKNTQN